MILVTGASGNVGAAVVNSLRTCRAAFRIGVHKPSEPLVEGDTASVLLDFLDPSTFRPATQGCSAVFLLRPPAIANMRSTLVPFIDIAHEAGIRQIVFLSVAGAADNPLVPHHAVEQHLRHESSGWTILRPGFFAQNLGDAYRDDILLNNCLFVPAGAGRVAFVDVRDVADVAADALLGEANQPGQAYTLTGPEAISFVSVAEILSSVVNREIRYQPASILAYFLHLKRRGMPVSQIIVQTILHIGLRFGQAGAVDTTLATLLGHKPRGLRDYVQDHRHLWIR